MERYCIDFLDNYESFFFCKHTAIKTAKICTVQANRPIMVYKRDKKKHLWKGIKSISKKD